MLLVSLEAKETRRCPTMGRLNRYTSGLAFYSTFSFVKKQKKNVVYNALLFVMVEKTPMSSDNSGAAHRSGRLILCSSALFCSGCDGIFCLQCFYSLERSIHFSSFSSEASAEGFTRHQFIPEEQL